MGEAPVSPRSREGAQRSATPTVPWAQLISGWPPAGTGWAVRSGRAMMPEVATGLPSAPSDRCRTSQFSPPGTAAAGLSRGRAWIGSPGTPSGSGIGGV
ncbi:hypothetical protein ABZ093_21460 [Streptomyces cyaneofuscatus]|uniref:hypothetical protein n=1 Tax=Streptomyces cyaneofuscatus TaxID=66883 RepID=UPI0033B20097